MREAWRRGGAGRLAAAGEYWSGGEKRQAESRLADGKKHATQLCAWD